MKKRIRILLILLGVCLVSTFKLAAQTVTYKANWGSTNNYIFSELNGFIVPYGFEIDVQGAASVTIQKFRINTSVSTVGMFDLATTTPVNKVARLLKVASADATLATTSSPSIGTVTLNPTYIEVTLNAANQTYTTGKHFFYLGLYVDLANFVGAKNTVRPVITLEFSLPTTTYTGNSFVSSVAQLDAPDDNAVPAQVKVFNLGIIYQWIGAVTGGDWANKGNWLYRDEDNINNGIPADYIPDTWDRCYFGEVNFNQQPVVNAAATTGSIYFFPNANKQITLTVNAGTLTLRNYIYQDYLTTSGVPTLLTGKGNISVGNLQIGIDPAKLPGSIASTTALRSDVKKLTVTNLVLFKAPLGHTSQFILEGGEMKINTGIETYHTNSNSESKFTIAPPSGTAILNFQHPTPLDLIIDNSGPLPRTASKGLAANGINTLDFNHPGSTVVYSTIKTGPAYTLYAGHANVTAGINYYNLETSTNTKFTATAGTLKVAGNWTTRGSNSTSILSSDLPNWIGKIDFLTNNTNIEFNGTGPQTITDLSSDGGKGVVFKNVLFSGGGAKTIKGGTFSIVPGGIVDIAANTMVTVAQTVNAFPNSIAALNLRSNASGSASVGIIPSTSSINGPVNVERWLTGGSSTFRGYRLLSSPVNSGGFTNGTGNIDMQYIGESALTAGSGAGFTVSNPNPTMYVYQEKEPAPSNLSFNSGKHKGITQIYSTGNVDIFGESANKNIPVGNGYIFYYIGKNTPNTTASSRIPENMAITAKGTLNQGNVPVKIWSQSNSFLSYTAASASSVGHNMVGNPYASTIDLNKVITDNSTIKTTLYQLSNINPGQKYMAYSSLGGNSDPKVSQYALSGQGFIVVANDAASTLTFNEAQKVPTQQLTGPVLLMGTPAGENVITGFYIKMEQDSLLNDYCGIYFRSDWKDEYDENDAIDLDGASPKVYMSSYSADGKRTAINRYADYTKSKPIKLFVNATTGGSYKLKIEDIRNIDALYDIWLRDHYLKDSVNIRETGTYNFSIDKSVAASFGGERFELFAKRKQYKLLAFTGEKVAEGVNISWKAENDALDTRFVLEKQDGSQQFIPIHYAQANGSGAYSYVDNTPSSGKNVYRLKQLNIHDQATYSDVITINYQTDGALNARFTIFPNPAVNVITVKLVASPTTALSMNVIDGKGTVLAVKTINGQETQHNVGQLPPGTYLVELFDKKLQKVIAIGKFVKL
ncbi:MAG: T9SS type A sorting domain-containing protein [Sphingobacteriaceae bacterium]